MRYEKLEYVILKLISDITIYFDKLIKYSLILFNLYLTRFEDK